MTQANHILPDYYVSHIYAYASFYTMNCTHEQQDKK